MDYAFKNFIESFVATNNRQLFISHNLVCQPLNFYGASSVPSQQTIFFRLICLGSGLHWAVGVGLPPPQLVFCISFRVARYFGAEFMKTSTSEFTHTVGNEREFD